MLYLCLKTYYEHKCEVKCNAGMQAYDKELSLCYFKVLRSYQIRIGMI